MLGRIGAMARLIPCSQPHQRRMICFGKYAKSASSTRPVCVSSYNYNSIFDIQTDHVAVGGAEIAADAGNRLAAVAVLGRGGARP